MTTKDAIKLLPISEDVKLQILKMYDYLEPDQKLTIQRIAWKTYDLLQASRIDENVEQQLEQVKNGQAHLGPDFYTKAIANSEQELTKNLEESHGAVDLAAARKAMEQIVSELQAAKLEKKAHSDSN